MNDVRQLMRLVAANPEDPWLRLELGQAFRVVGQLSNAIGELERCLDGLRGHKRCEAQKLLRRTRRARRVGRLIEDTEEVVKAIPSDPQVWAVTATAPPNRLRVQAIPAAEPAPALVPEPPADDSLSWAQAGMGLALLFVSTYAVGYVVWSGVRALL